MLHEVRKKIDHVEKMEHAAAASKLVTEGEREIRENAADSSATDYSSVTSEESQKHRSADIRAVSASRTVRGQRCGAEVEGGGRRPRRQLKWVNERPR